MEQLGGLGLVAGRYRLIEVLGRGGMGTVWRAEDELLGRAVAVKVIAAPDALINPDSLAEPPAETHAQTAGRARREARAAGRLNHPGAVTVHDIIEEDHRFHIIMELIRAPTLSELVRAEGPLSPARVAAIGEQLLDVLDFAHTEGIVHRDVKPSNVMVLPHDRVKLTDFGIALLRGEPQLTASGATLGSPMFMAPEQASGSSVGPAADLWSLGATMYYAVEGRVPFDREIAMAALAAIVSQPPDPTRLAGPLEPALAALLVRTPENRPDGDVLRRLLALAGPGGGSDGDNGLQTLSADDPDATLDLETSPPSGTVRLNPVTANPKPASPEIPIYGSPEATRLTSRATEQDQPTDHPGPVGPFQPATRASSRVSRRDGRAMKGLVGALTVAVATFTFVLVQNDSDQDKQSGSNAETVQQDPGKAKPAGESDTALSPLAPDAPSDGLGLGSAGRANLRELDPVDVGPRGQNLERFFDSASNKVGGYTVGVPLAFESVAVGPTTFIDRNDTMFRSAFEVRSYRSVDPWARLVQDEKQFAKEHAGDGYKRGELTRQWTYAGKKASAWEFTWTLNGELMHAREVAFRVGPRTYTVLYRSVDLWWYSGGSSEWPEGFERSFFPTP